MKTQRLLATLIVSLGLTLPVQFLMPISRASPLGPIGLAVTNASEENQGPLACQTWDLASDFRVSPNQTNPNPDSCGNPGVWHYMRSTDFNRDPQTYSLLPYFTTSSSGIQGLEKWTGTDSLPPPDGLPEFVINTTGVTQDVGYALPPNVIEAHPAAWRLAIAGWRSPIAGSVTIKGFVTDLNAGCGDGVSWYIDKGATNLAAGSIANGGSQDFHDGTGGASLAAVAINEGDYVYFAIHPNNDEWCDSTELDVSISLLQESPPKISVTPDALTSSQYVNEVTTQNLTIANDGEAPLEFQIWAGGGPGVSFSAVSTQLYGYDVPQAWLRVVGTQNGTHVQVIDLASGQVIAENTNLNRYDVWDVYPPDGTHYKVEADKRVMGYESNFDAWSHTTFAPSLDSGPVGQEFIFYSHRGYYSGAVYLFAVDDCTVEVYDTSDSLVESRTMQAGEYWDLSLTNAVYHVVSSGRITIESVAANGYSTVPATDGMGVGRQFYFATYRDFTGALAVFAYEASDVHVYDMDSDELLYNQHIDQGNYWWQTGVGTRRLRLESSGVVEVWAGDAEGGNTIEYLGDDISFAAGKNAQEYYVHSLIGGSAIFVPFDNTTVDVDGTVHHLNKDEFLHLDGCCYLRHVQANRPVLIQTLGADTTWNDMGTYLGGVVEGVASVPWMAINPTSGVVPANTSMPVQVTFDATQKQPGDYGAQLAVLSNDPANPVVAVPVMMHVLPTATMGWVEGTVTDASTGNPLAAALTALGQPYTVEADLNTGHYKLWLDQGACTLQATAEGYVVGTAQVTVVAGQGVTQDWALALNVPVINVSPASMDVAQKVGEKTTRQMTIGNAGPATLEYTVGGGLVLWNKLGSDDEVLHSEIGPDGTIMGAEYAYEPAKYGNGYVRKAVGLNYLQFPASVLDDLHERGSIELWVNPKVAQPVPYQYGVFGLLGARGGFYGVPGNWNVGLFWGDTVSGRGLFGEIKFDENNVARTLDEPTQFVATPFEPFHAAICWDIAGIDGTADKVRVYRDGQLVGSTADAWNPSGTDRYDLILGYGPDGGGYDKFIADNIKIWNHAKTDFSDRFVEASTAGVSWLSLDPSSGAVPASSLAQVQVTFDSTAVQPGSYTAHIVVQSNDPVTPMVAVPVAMTVLPTESMGWVEGTVSQAWTGNPLAATITAVGQPYTVATDASTGHYKLWLEAGSYTLKVMSPGYLSQTAEVTIKTHQGVTQDWRLAVDALPPVAAFWLSPAEPTVFDTVQFYDASYDTSWVGIQSWVWDLGDGTMAEGTNPSHAYATDEDYTVKLTVATLDGRTASVSQVVHVKTHDVAIVKLGAPQSANVGQTRHVTVDIKSNRYPENVRVELYKSAPGGFQWVGTLNMLAPVRKSNRTTQFDFSYTFTAEDALMGKVTFRAVAILVDAYDALPADNEAIALPTKINR